MPFGLDKLRFHGGEEGFLILFVFAEDFPEELEELLEIVKLLGTDLGFQCAHIFLKMVLVQDLQPVKNAHPIFL